MTFRLPISAAAALLLAAAPGPAAAQEAARPPVLRPGELRLAAAGGATVVDRVWGYGVELSARGGIAEGVEIAGPLALAVTLVDAGDGSGLAVAGGVVDLWAADGEVLWSPAAALYAQLRTATSASLRAAVDLTGVERGGGGAEHPAWIRGGAALIVDVGPFVSIAAGVSYQRRLLGGEAVPGAARLGWAGDARVSLGAVRAQPFEELPTLAIHLGRAVDVIAILRVDVDVERRATDARYLLGLRVDVDARPGRGGGAPE